MLSSDMYCPLPHVGCALHEMSLCPLLLLYVLAGQAEQIRASAAESEEITWPLLHTVCVLQLVCRWLVLSW